MAVIARVTTNGAEPLPESVSGAPTLEFTQPPHICSQVGPAIAHIFQMRLGKYGYPPMDLHLRRARVCFSEQIQNLNP